MKQIEQAAQVAWSSGIGIPVQLKRERLTNPAYGKAFDNPVLHVDIKSGIIKVDRLREVMRGYVPSMW